MRVSQAQQFVQLGSRILSTMVKFYMKFCARPAKVAKAGINCCWFGLSGNNRLTDLDTTQTALTLVMETKCPLTNTPPRLTWPNQTSVSLVRLLPTLALQTKLSLSAGRCVAAAGSCFHGFDHNHPMKPTHHSTNWWQGQFVMLSCEHWTGLFGEKGLT